MPQRIQMIVNLLEVFFLNMFNAIILVFVPIIISWMSVFAFIPIIISSVYGFGRIKRDVDKYHDGKPMEYFKYLIGKGKKN